MYDNGLALHFHERPHRWLGSRLKNFARAMAESAKGRLLSISIEVPVPLHSPRSVNTSHTTISNADTPGWDTSRRPNLKTTSTCQDKRKTGMSNCSHLTSLHGSRGPVSAEQVKSVLNNAAMTPRKDFC